MWLWSREREWRALTTVRPKGPETSKELLNQRTTNHTFSKDCLTGSQPLLGTDIQNEPVKGIFHLKIILFFSIHSCLSNQYDFQKTKHILKNISTVITKVLCIKKWNKDIFKTLVFCRKLRKSTFSFFWENLPFNQTRTSLIHLLMFWEKQVNNNVGEKMNQKKRQSRVKAPFSTQFVYLHVLDVILHMQIVN